MSSIAIRPMPNVCSHPLIARVTNAPGGYNAERTRMDLTFRMAVVAAVQSTSKETIVEVANFGRKSAAFDHHRQSADRYDDCADCELRQQPARRKRESAATELWDGIETLAAIMTMK